MNRKRSHSLDIASSKSGFSFLKLKSEFEDILQRYNNIIEDFGDFWTFVKKFEMINKSPTEETDKRLCLQCEITPEEIIKRLTKNISYDKIARFVKVIQAYLNFKQTEKFSKLLKIRQSQKELPVAAYESQINHLIISENILIIAGDTGCGKSTQIPRYLINCGFERVICTQPRRLACISLANRLKHETLSEHFNEVGYQIRFERKRSKTTRILFITEGLLLRQIAMDPSLEAYQVIILDEVHERHLQSDFLLGLLKCLLMKREDLKIVLMSATINIELFRGYFFGQAKVVQVPGRLFPVEMHFRPFIKLGGEPKKRTKLNCTPYLQILQIIETKYKGEKGDVLIFLSGISEIMCLVEAIKDFNKEDSHWIVLPLHSSLSLVDQDKVFDFPPAGHRKCIVSTNIAETSLTIDGIRFVIDSGKVKEMSYDAISKIQRLKEFWISKSSAEQRKGRAGRTGPGICYRIYSEEDYEAMDDFTTPEIKRVPLETVLLQIIAMGLPDVRKFPFLEPPSDEAIENCVISLKQLGALTDEEKITELGKMLTNLPVEITIGKMLLMGCIFQQIETILVLAAALSVQSPLTNYAFRDLDCEAARKDVESDFGDPVSLVKMYKEWLNIKYEKEESRRWCRTRGLEEQRFYEITKLRMQFKDILTETGLLEVSQDQPTNSAERRIRNGEIKLLKSLKFKATKTSTRKELKITMFDREEEDFDEVDLRDVEFRLKTDPSSIYKFINDINVSRRKDIDILRLIFCSALYPQFAIADEFNSRKNEQVFHTKAKSYVFLHPMSYFGNHPDLLKLETPEIVIPPNHIKYTSRLPFSAKHQLLCYLNMLETTKVYLTNMIRMPALQTFLLFSKQIDTSFDFSKIVCDNWVTFELLYPQQGEALILRLVSLRKQLNQIIDQKLAKQLESGSIYRLIADLLNFINSEIVYGIKRLLPADLKYIYTNSPFEVESNPFDLDFQPVFNDKKGGVWLTNFLTYNCVIGNENQDMYKSEAFSCERCNLETEFNAWQRLLHQRDCQVTVKETQEEDVGKSSTGSQFVCENCSKKFTMSAIEILRHKRTCK